MPVVINPKTKKAKHLSYSKKGKAAARRAAAKGMIVKNMKKTKKSSY
jgi:hypothetical protein|tara:strand:- start:235 stop:375 length:141 start_codon:yes stop_codon:yes gene_type:complete